METCNNSSFVEAKIDITLYGNQEKPVLLLNFKNIGVNPIKIDQELVFLVTIVAVGPNETAFQLEEIESIATPDRKALKSRFILVQPNQSLQRKIELKDSFKCFVCGIGTFDTHIEVTAYEVLTRLPKHTNPERIDIIYAPFYGFREGFAQYTGMESTALGLFEGPLHASIEWDQIGK